MGRTEIEKQTRFCKELMDRINDSVSKCKHGHTVIITDIIRLRRELNELKAMLELAGYNYRKN